MVRVFRSPETKKFENHWSKRILPFVRKEQEAEPRRLNKSMKEAQSKELRMAAKEQLPCYTGKNNNKHIHTSGQGRSLKII